MESRMTTVFFPAATMVETGNSGGGGGGGGGGEGNIWVGVGFYG